MIKSAFNCAVYVALESEVSVEDDNVCDDNVFDLCDTFTTDTTILT